MENALEDTEIEAEEITAEFDTDRRDGSPENQYRRSIYSVPVEVTVSLGQQRISVAELLGLKEDAILPLSSELEDPIDLIVEGKTVARGELIETPDGSLAIKITEIPEQSNG